MSDNNSLNPYSYKDTNSNVGSSTQPTSTDTKKIGEELKEHQQKELEEREKNIPDLEK